MSTAIREAIDCIRYSIPPSCRESDLEGVPALLATMLSTIIQSACCVQEMSKKENRMGSISLGVYASVSGGDPKEQRKIFTLFGPALESPAVYAPATDASAVDGTEELGGDEMHQEDFGVRRNAMEGGENAMEGGGRSQALETDNTAKIEIENRANYHVNENENSSGETLYHVPDDIAASCLSFFIDGSGNSSHPSAYKEKDMESVNAKMVIRTLKRLFEKQRSKLVERGVRKQGIRYMSLVPEHLRKKELLFPNLTLQRAESGASYRKDGYLRVKMVIGKADRNRKEQNLAVVATMLHFRGHGLDVEETLSEFSRDGLGWKGCNLFQGCRARNLNIPCRDELKDLGSLYGEVEGERRIVAKGVVDPFSTFLGGREISKGCVMVRVNSVMCTEEIRSHTQFIGESGRLEKGAYIWPMADLGRTEILGEFDTVLGTGIVVSEQVIRSTGSVSNVMDVRNSIMLCNVRFDEGNVNDRYPFSEWYSNRLVAKLRSYLKISPRKLGDVMKCRGEVMLWRKDLVRQP